MKAATVFIALYTGEFQGGQDPRTARQDTRLTEGLQSVWRDVRASMMSRHTYSQDGDGYSVDDFEHDTHSRDGVM